MAMIDNINTHESFEDPTKMASFEKQAILRQSHIVRHMVIYR